VKKTNEEELMVVKLLPTINDILFGRGHSISNHEGNRRLRHIIDKYEEEYHLIAKTRATKIQTMHKILREISENGARFLRYDYSTKAWYEVDRKTVVEKVRRFVLACRFSHKGSSGCLLALKIVPVT
jgi:hypothetical protein